MRRVVVAIRWDELTLWDRERNGERKIRDESVARFVSVAFSPDGKRIATGDTDGHVHLWDTESLKKVAAFDVGGTPNREFLHPLAILLALPVWAIAWVVASRKRPKRIGRKRVRPGIRT
jgi:WD40 repeat protein